MWKIERKRDSKIIIQWKIQAICSDYKILNKTGCYYNEFLFLIKLFFTSYSYSLKNKLLFYFYASIQAKLFISIIQQKNIQSCLEERVKDKPKKK